MKEKVNEIIISFNTAGRFIDRHTAAACPACPDVCCRRKHCRYDESDIRFIKAVNEALDEEPFMPPAGGPPAPEDEDLPCVFLTDKGCPLPRHYRPFRCTWYFCEALLGSMRAERPKDYRKFISALNDLTAKRQNLLEATALTG